MSLPEPVEGPLAGIKIVTIAVNLPGPVAAARLAKLGADVTKIEPPTGDPLRFGARSYYEELIEAQTVRELDLKEPTARQTFEDLLAEADLLMTSHRSAALQRLGLGWDDLHERHPQLNQVAIVGSPSPHDDLAGHDLTYQAMNGILDPAAFPRVLVADLAGAERAVSEALAALIQRAATGGGNYREVALSVAAAAMADPYRHGLTAPSGVLGGAVPEYGIYDTADRPIAVAALEPHFAARLAELLDSDGTRSGYEAAFATRTAQEWVEWARVNDIPLESVDL